MKKPAAMRVVTQMGVAAVMAVRLHATADQCGRAVVVFLIFVVAIGLSAWLAFDLIAGITLSLVIAAAGYTARQVMRDN